MPYENLRCVSIHAASLVDLMLLKGAAKPVVKHRSNRMLDSKSDALLEEMLAEMDDGKAAPR